MPATLHCAQRHRDHYLIQGSGQTPYVVRMFQVDRQGNDLINTCTCIGFKTKQNKNANIIGGGYAGAGTGLAAQTAAWCKHLKFVTENTCSWVGKPGEKQIQCPKCGGPVIDQQATRLAPGQPGPVHGVVSTPQPVAKPAPKPKPKTPPKPPAALLKLAAQLAAEVEADKPKEDKPKKGKSFEEITSKKPKSTAPASADDAAKALADMLKNA